VAKGRGQDLRFANIQVSLSASAWRSRRHNLHVSRISVACSSVFDGKDRRSTSAKILHFGKTREAARQRVTKVDFAFDTHRQGSMTKRVALAASALKKARWRRQENYETHETPIHACDLVCWEYITKRIRRTKKFEKSGIVLPRFPLPRVRICRKCIPYKSGLTVFWSIGSGLKRHPARKTEVVGYFSFICEIYNLLMPGLTMNLTLWTKWGRKRNTAITTYT